MQVLAGTQKHKHSNIIYDKSRKLIKDLEAKLELCKNYIEELFSDETNNFPLENTQEDKGPGITKEEL